MWYVYISDQLDSNTYSKDDLVCASTEGGCNPDISAKKAFVRLWNRTCTVCFVGTAQHYVVEFAVFVVWALEISWFLILEGQCEVDTLPLIPEDFSIWI